MAAVLRLTVALALCALAAPAFAQDGRFQDRRDDRRFDDRRDNDRRTNDRRTNDRRFDDRRPSTQRPFDRRDNDRRFGERPYLDQQSQGPLIQRPYEKPTLNLVRFDRSFSGVINYDCAREEGARYVISIDLNSDLVRHMDIDKEGKSFGWQGPTRAHHRQEWIAWSGMQDRTQWTFDRARRNLEIQVIGGDGPPDGRPPKPTSAKLSCAPMLPDYVKVQ